MAEPIRVLIADDHALLREGLRKILELEDDIAVVGEAVDGHDVVEKARALRPDIVLMDINMPGGGGLAATRQICGSLPEVAVIVLTIHDDEEYIVELVHAGAKGYLLKDVDPSRLVEAIRCVHRGEAFIPSNLVTKVLKQLHRHSRRSTDPPPATISSRNNRPSALREPLTERELEILQQIVEGHTNKEIAQTLFISEKTVKNHVTNILRKLDLSDRTQAAVFAIRHGLVRVN